MVFAAIRKVLKPVAAVFVLALPAALGLPSTRASANVDEIGSCSGQNLILPFADVPGGSLFFCAIAGAYFSGLINGSSAAYNPSGTVMRDQMAAFVLRTQDSAVRRASRRAAANLWAVPKNLAAVRFVPLLSGAGAPNFDGEDIWVTGTDGAAIVRIHASDGRFIDAKIGTVKAVSTIAAAGYVYAVGRSVPGHLYRLDPSIPDAAVENVASNLGGNPSSITFDGANLWTADQGTGPGFSLERVGPAEQRLESRAHVDASGSSCDADGKRPLRRGFRGVRRRAHSGRRYEQEPGRKFGLALESEYARSCRVGFAWRDFTAPGVAGDGLHFWISLNSGGGGYLARF